MGQEIERKFLVTGEFRHLAIKKIRITQGYLSVDPARIIRLRISGNTAILSVKSPVNESVLSRKEWEFKIPVTAAREILEVCLPGRIEKTRYIIPSGLHNFEVDVFHGKNEGLCVAEIELSDEDEIFEKPGWLGEEVTGKPEFYNVNLL
jgi:adenylate cyclase